MNSSYMFLLTAIAWAASCQEDYQRIDCEILIPDDTTCQQRADGLCSVNVTCCGVKSGDTMYCGYDCNVNCLVINHITIPECYCYGLPAINRCQYKCHTRQDSREVTDASNYTSGTTAPTTVAPNRPDSSTDPEQAGRASPGVPPGLPSTTRWITGPSDGRPTDPGLRDPSAVYSTPFAESDPSPLTVVHHLGVTVGVGVGVAIGLFVVLVAILVVVLVTRRRCRSRCRAHEQLDNDSYSSLPPTSGGVTQPTEPHYEEVDDIPPPVSPRPDLRTPPVRAIAEYDNAQNGVLPVVPCYESRDLAQRDSNCSTSSDTVLIDSMVGVDSLCSSL